MPRRPLTRRSTLALLGAVSACAAPAGPPLSLADQRSVDRVQRWLDGLHGLRARFVQIGAGGGVQQGVALFDPPGRLRLDYAPGDRLTLIANDGHIVVTNAALGSTTRMPASASPLGLLLDGPIRLSGDVRVTDVARAAGALQVSLARADNLTAGLLTLTFNDEPDGSLTLVALEATDAERQRTRFRLFDQQTGLRFAPSLFALGTGA